MVKQKRTTKARVHVQRRKTSMRTPARSLHRSTKQRISQESSRSFYSFFLKELGRLYDVENRLLDIFPSIIKASTTKDLKEALIQHFKETRNQLTRLNRIFNILGERVRREPCEAIQGLIEEMREVLKGKLEPIVRDVGIIAVAQKIEHYEISCYGTARSFAKQLNLSEIASLLDDSLDEEANADDVLTTVAEGGFFSSGINKKAVTV